jgi:hypothetical protein
MYDEAIQRAIRRKKIRPITFDAEYLKELISNFKSNYAKSVILTGTAGDGKTYYCREIWQAFGGSNKDWESPDKVKSLNIENKQLYIIKDLSELSQNDNVIIERIANSILNSQDKNIYLIAANDGQLIEALRKAGNSQNISALRDCIEDLLVNDKRRNPGFNLLLYNLSRTSAARIFPRILGAISEHEGWEDCNQCLYNSDAESKKRCPILENKKRLDGVESGKIIKTRLNDLLLLSELNGMHLPIRQLLILIANMLLGNPHARDRLLSCQEIPRILEEEKASDSSLYRNIFGENLSERKRDNTEVFAILGRFGIGNETSNRIDNILIFGEDDLELRPYYERLVLSDPYYGANENFKAAQKSYLEGDAPDGEHIFLETLRSQRQRLFFTIPPEDADDMKLWDLTIFHYAGEYLNDVYNVALKKERSPRFILSRLVRGFNRISTGLLIKNQDDLILASSGSHSQARVSHVLEEFISVSKKRGESVNIDMGEDGKLNLTVSFSLSPNIAPVRLNLILMRYEFLCRVAEGALPGSFSRECYEDMLAFKSRLLRQLELRRNEENEEDENMSIRLLKLNSDGMASDITLEVYR